MHKTAYDIGADLARKEAGLGSFVTGARSAVNNAAGKLYKPLSMPAGQGLKQVGIDSIKNPHAVMQGVGTAMELVPHPTMQMAGNALSSLGTGLGVYKHTGRISNALMAGGMQGLAGQALDASGAGALKSLAVGEGIGFWLKHAPKAGWGRYVR